MVAADGKYYKTDVMDTEQFFRIRQSIPNKKSRTVQIGWLKPISYSTYLSVK
jgi:hypothetical protein